MSVVGRFLPQRIKDAIKVAIGTATAADRQPPPPYPQRCPVCGTDGVQFVPLPSSYFAALHQHGFIHSMFLFETLNLEGYSCSHCGAADRDRLYALYLRNALKDNSQPKLLLDIAPARALAPFLRGLPRVTVRTADLYMPGVDDKVDLANMHQYADHSFDLFLCSHVLEHIPDDRAAMRELFRVLKPGGWGIAMAPVHLGLDDTREDPTLTDIGERWRQFGQDDHIRIYSKRGFIERLTTAGFRVEQFDQHHFSPDVFREHGVHPRSVLYVVHRPA